MPPKGKPFVSGDPRINAGGRPRIPKEVRKTLRSLVPEALDSLRKDLTDPDPEVRAGARNVVFAYNLGVPEGFSDDEPDEVAGTGRVLTSYMTDGELETVQRAMASAQQRADAATGGDRAALPATSES